MNRCRNYGTATLLNNGKVLLAGGESGCDNAELYGPAADTPGPTFNMNACRNNHTATLLNNGKVLVAGGSQLTSAELATFMPGNIFTGTLTLPSGWISSTISAQFVGTTSAAAINAGALSNDNNTWSSWIATTSDVTATTTWNVSIEGTNKSVYLRLRDVNDQVATVVIGTVNDDLTAPTGSVVINGGASFTPSTNVMLTLSATDPTSGVAQMSFSNDGTTWTDWEGYAPSKSWALANGDGSKTVYARFKDNAGNVSGNVTNSITLDTTAPAPGGLVINSGALSSTSTNVTVSVGATDNTQRPTPRMPRSVSEMSFSNDNVAWSNWQTCATSDAWTLVPGDGLKTVYARFQDSVGNVSSVSSNTITLDTAAGTQYGMTINNGALFTNQISVTLTIGALPGTTRMMVSNDGGFAGTQWEPYNSRKPWTITQYGSYVIPRVVYVRYGDVNGTVLNTSQDDIILDVNPPTGSVAIVSPTSSAARRANPTVALSLSATDDVSGVGGMMLSNRSDFAGASWQTYATSATWTLDNNKTVYARFKDNAGNVSQTYSAGGQSSVYLPLIVR